MPDRLSACRSCGSIAVRTFLSLGDTPLADALVRPADIASPEDRFPLAVAFCASCTLVQVTEEVPPEQLFVQNYLYFSSFSRSVLAHAREHAETLIQERELGANSLVVEIASNDGYLLKNFVEHGIPVLGIDPAPDQAAAAVANGVPTIAEFFNPDLARRLRAEGKSVDVIIANNVLAHVPDLNGFVEGIRILLAPEGVLTVENPYVRDLITHGEFDTIYHEHHSYFSCTAIDRLMRRHGLYLNHVEYFPWLHGGTLRWHIGHRPNVSREARAYLETERGMLTSFKYYAAFGEQAEQTRRDLVALLTGLREGGATIAAYGAAAKGSTLLNYAGIGTDLIDFVVDRNPHKQGLLMPGVHIPIKAPEALLEESPDYVLLLAWNFKDEIAAEQSEYLRRGGRFIVPVPHPEVLDTTEAPAMSEMIGS